MPRRPRPPKPPRDNSLPWHMVDAFVVTHPDGGTLSEVAEVFGVTKQRIAQIERAALAKMRPALADIASARVEDRGRGAVAVAALDARRLARIMDAVDDGLDSALAIGDAWGLDDIERAAMGRRLARLVDAGMLETHGRDGGMTYARATRGPVAAE